MHVASCAGVLRSNEDSKFSRRSSISSPELFVGEMELKGMKELCCGKKCTSSHHSPLLFDTSSIQQALSRSVDRFRISTGGGTAVRAKRSVDSLHSVAGELSLVDNLSIVV